MLLGGQVVVSVVLRDSDGMRVSIPKTFIGEELILLRYFSEVLFFPLQLKLATHITRERIIQHISEKEADVKTFPVMSNDAANELTLARSWRNGWKVVVAPLAIEIYYRYVQIATRYNSGRCTLQVRGPYSTRIRYYCYSACGRLLHFSFNDQI